MALDDEIEANWSGYFFSSLLDSVHRAHLSSPTKRVNEVHYRLMASYLLEIKMPMVDRGEELTDSYYLPHNPSKGRVFKLNPSIRIPNNISQEYMDRFEKSMAEKGLSSLVPPTPVKVTAEWEDQKKERQKRMHFELKRHLEKDKLSALPTLKPKELTRARSAALNAQIVQRLTNGTTIEKPQS